jgi:type II secretory pathway component PulK
MNKSTKRNGMALLIVLIVLTMLAGMLAITANQAVLAKRVLVQKWNQAQTEQIVLAALDRTSHFLSLDPQYKGDSWQINMPGNAADELRVNSEVSAESDDQFVVKLKIENVSQGREVLAKSYLLKRTPK